MADWVWCVICSTIAIWLYTREDSVSRFERKAAKQAKRNRKKEVANLKEKGYTDEMICVILPTINA